MSRDSNFSHFLPTLLCQVSIGGWRMQKVEECENDRELYFHGCPEYAKHRKKCECSSLSLSNLRSKCESGELNFSSQLENPDQTINSHNNLLTHHTGCWVSSEKLLSPFHCFRELAFAFPFVLSAATQKSGTSHFLEGCWSLKYKFGTKMLLFV